MAIRCFALAALVPLFACSSIAAPKDAPNTAAAEATPQDAAKPADASKDDKKDKEKEKADAKKQKAKELRNKIRELEQARVEIEVQAIDRQVREENVAAQVRRTAEDLARAQKELELFTSQVRPRELEERRIQLDQNTYQAEHAKDELGELEAMYQADEFAKTTKELVLKRGRRQLEMAERELAVSKKASAHFEQHVMVERERELRRKLEDAELEQKKAGLEARKAALELGVADQKNRNRIGDLEDDIKELQEALAKEAS